LLPPSHDACGCSTQTTSTINLKRSTLPPHEGQADRPNTPSDSVNLGSNPGPPASYALTTILFLGGWLSPVPFSPFIAAPGAVWFILKVCLVFFLIAMVKAFVPRYRYDQLMRLGWKVFLPLSLAMVAIVAGVLQYAGLAPKL